MAKKEHIGFQLHDDRPIDKKVIDILNSLPERENKCAFIRKAIIFYDDHKDDFENTPSGDKLNDEKLDLILKKLDAITGMTEFQTEREEESHPAQPAPESSPSVEPEEEPEEIPEEKPEKKAKKVEKKEEKKEIKDDDDHLEVTADTDVNSEAYMDALGDFLG